MSIIKAQLYFFNLSKTSPNCLGKTFKVVLFECWSFVYWLVVFETNDAQFSKLPQKVLPKFVFQEISETNEVLMKYGQAK